MIECIVVNCHEPARARQRCIKHYQSAKRSGELLTTEQLAVVVNNNRDQIEVWMREAGWTPPGTNPFAK